MLGRRLARARLRLVAQLQEDGKVVRADVRQPAQLAEAEVGGVEDVVQRVAAERVVGVEAAVEPPPDARVEEPAQAEEQLARGRPRHVVEVARHHGGALAVGADRLADDHELGVARRGGLPADRLGRTRVQPVEGHARAVGQLELRVHRRDVVLHEVVDARRDQRQAGEEHQAVVVLLRLAHDVRVRPGQRLQRPRPRGVGLQGEHDVGVGVADHLEEPGVLPVLHQHVGDEEPEGRPLLGHRRPPAVAALHLHPGERRVRVHLPPLPERAQQERREEGPVRRPAAGEEPRVDEPRGDRHRRDLHAREVPDPHEPVRAPAEAEQRRGDGAEPEPDHDPLEHDQHSPGPDEVADHGPVRPCPRTARQLPPGHLTTGQWRCRRARHPLPLGPPRARGA
ncbi:MAG: hypothetical protein AVDCRST_MAG40-3038 [uncultured Gemmatimonadaceae bacterium]|uniref:Uncharacterized protein n=1 Tax=uncultured Gemmatimonadaceae bacterium TaxID=246130 RepID=A0A6J4MC52_9BACT|nr:MAG: hypothetical protein AVDCRST_MAG40-3038 [uncultured Gemmatimonadaceae bacterium]